MSVLTTTKSIAEYQDAIYNFDYEVRNEGLDVHSVPFEALLRPFRFLNDDFEDFRNASMACMPLFAGFIIASAGNEDATYTVDSVKQTLELLGAYLDGRNIEIREHQDPAELIKLSYDFDEHFAKAVNDIMAIPLISQQEEYLMSVADDALKNMLALSPAERIEQYKELAQSFTTCKNAVYNIIRKNGKDLLPQIEQHIESLIPADQAYILHGLDAFPKNKGIIAFYQSFLEKHADEWIAGETKKYLGRVESGKKTTGWEN